MSKCKKIDNFKQNFWSSNNFKMVSIYISNIKTILLLKFAEVCEYEIWWLISIYDIIYLFIYV